MRVYVALDVKRTDGPRLPADVVLELVEDATGPSIYDGESEFDVQVEGIGRTLDELRESVARRKQIPR